MIASKIATSVTNDQAKKIKEIIRNIGLAYVTIGFHEDAGRYPGSNAPSVVQVALWNEFGTQTSPERSFIRSAIDGNEGLINSWREEAIHNILELKWPIQKALAMVGFRIQVLIQNKIKSNVPPPNAASTIKEKARSGVGPRGGFKAGFEGRTGTLIDTGLMLRSVTYKVVVQKK